MQVSVTEAKAQLTELVRRAETGSEVILTRHGQAAVRLVPVRVPLDATSRRALLERVRGVAYAGKAGVNAGPETTSDVSPGASAARSQDCLYDEDGVRG